MEMWKCSRCDTKNQDNMKFCQVCHAPRPADEPNQEPEKKKKTVPRSAVPDQPEKKPEPFVLEPPKNKLSITLIAANLALLAANIIGLIMLIKK